MGSATTTATETEVRSLARVGSGKVRDLYALDAARLLVVATDRISAFDVVMANGVPGKGVVLNQLSAFWLGVLERRVAGGLRHHLLGLGAPADAAPALTAAERAGLRGRSMTVRRLRVFPIEAIVRGYLAGSAWREYAASGTMHGLPLPPGLVQCAELPRAMYTPSTKAAAGAHDENITPAQAAAIVGERYARRIEVLALAVYQAARDFALERGLILADTKLEFGLDEAADEVVLIDEVCTPDSSRFWLRDAYAPGRDQESFDKEPLRQWLRREGLAGREGAAMPDDVVRATAARYRHVFAVLTGKTPEQAVADAEGPEDGSLQ